MTFRTYSLVIVLLVSVFIGCKDTNSAESENTNDTTIDSIALKNSTAQDKVTVYAWVDKLRVRTEPDTKSDVVIEVAEGESMTYLDEKTDFTDQFTLRGKAYDEPWLKVKTSSGKQGWVYGGGVKFYQPKVAAVPTPYDGCMDYFKRRRDKQAADCFGRIEAKQLAKDRRIVRKTEAGSLEFTLLSGETKTLMGSEDRRFIYRYYIPKMGLLVVENSQADSSSYLLINDKSGKETVAWGFPVASPDYRHLLVTNGDLTNKTTPNGVQLFGYTNQGLKVVWEKELEKYEPIIAKWLDVGQAEVTLLPTSASGHLKLKIAELKLNEAGAWEIEE